MIRRSFIKNLGVLGVAAAAPVELIKAAEAPVSTEGIDLSTTTLKGRVSAGGKGIEGVAVTDGINVTRTNGSGSYELLSNKTTGFVYISLPAGYEFPHQNSISQFYKKIDHSKNTFAADFQLTKLSQSDDKHAFVVWADPQIQNRKDADLLLTQSAPDLKELVDSYGKNMLMHGIGCGDLIFDRFELFADYKKAIAMSGIPFFNVIGNHDMDLEARTDEGSTETFKEQFGPTYYSFNRGKIHYVVLDDVFFMGVPKRYMGYINETQLKWLEQDLKQVKPGTTVVLSVHIPTNTGQRQRDQSTEPELGGVVINRQRLYDLLKPYTVHIMSGHTHFNEVWINENITEHNHGTVCGAWWTGPICGDGTPNGYGVYEVDGDKLSWYYKATGKPKTHQLRIYGRGRHKSFPEDVAVNVWNYDKNWKLEWFADGRSMGQPEQRTAHDPWALETLLGKSLPATRGWAEPNLTDHIFFMKPAADVKNIRVTATDPFGNTYGETLALNA
ncbi:calcineurin-like phosphoesterase family protein [Pedobacter sp. SYSU D00535]|uniref:calcineurin-like phosphoesterase C-terminal domain-containing protein n=1 Tax=Pedobacter sp. SYSU D00535 TaxID=2810308 RepID=UPI001A96F746|nr:calcineurin-like phosphoesterase family protein [Pedobacter sp. SYSU D00535]